MNQEAHKFCEVMSRCYGENLRLQEIIPSLFESLLSDGIIKQAEVSKVITCKGCGLAHQVLRNKEKYYIQCTDEEFGGINEIKPEDSVTYKFDYAKFCGWVADSLKLEKEVTEEDSTIWHIGKGLIKKNETHLFVVFTTDFSVALSILEAIPKKNVIVLFLGKIPLLGHVDLRILSLQDILDVVDGKLEFLKKEFNKLTKGNYLSGPSGTIVLDTNIVITIKGDKHCLQLQKTPIGFTVEKDIFPMSYNILQNLFRFKDSEVLAFTSRELSNKGLARNAKTITTRILEINKLCEEKDLIPPIIQEDNYRYRLNPKLSCFK